MLKASPLVLVLLVAACCPAPVATRPDPAEVARLCGELMPPADPGPKAVTEQFLRAIERKDCAALVACAPPEVVTLRTSEKLIAGCERHLSELVALAVAIRASTAAPRKVSENRVELNFGEHGTLVLIRRAERWYIEDL